MRPWCLRLLLVWLIPSATCDLPSMVGDDAGESDGIMKLHEDSESVVECHSRHRRFSARVSGDRVGPGEGLGSLSGESEGLIGLLEVSESDVSLHSRIHGSSLARTCAGVGECGVGVGVCGARVRVFAGFVVRCSVGLPAVCALTCAQVASNACGEVARACNSGSFARNQGVLVVCCLRANPPVTTWRWVVRVPGGGAAPKRSVSGPAEDLRPVSEVDAGVKLRLAGGVRGAGCRFTPWKATRHRYQTRWWWCGDTFCPPGSS